MFLSILRWTVLCALMLALTSCVSSTLSVGSGEISAKRKISYGPLSRQKYNVYRPADDDGTAPVVVFFYGGSWSGGDRKTYSFVGKTLARQGFVAAIPDYRVYPDVVFPAFVEDGALAVAAIKKRLSPDRPLFLVGHSAGAHIAALLTVDKSFLAAKGVSVCNAVAGFAGLAGPYDFTPARRGKYSRIFPKGTRTRSKPINFVSASVPPTLLLHGSGDSTVAPRHSSRFHARLKSAGVASNLKTYPGVGHVGILGAFSSIVPTSANSVEDVTNFVRKFASVRGNTCS